MIFAKQAKQGRRSRLTKFVKKSIDNRKKLLIILVCISFVSGISAFLLQFFLGGSTIYRAELFIEVVDDVNPTILINTAGMRVEVVPWDGETVKIECVSELPLIIEDITEESNQGLIKNQTVTISQDDGFVVSLFTTELFRYRMKVYLPQSRVYKEITVNSSVANTNVYVDELLQIQEVRI